MGKVNSEFIKNEIEILEIKVSSLDEKKIETQ